MSVLNAFWPWDRLALLWPGAMLTDLRFVLVMGWFLQPHGCDEGQGYYFSRAIAAERDSHDGPEGDALERIVPGAKSYTRAQWDEFVRALEALPDKPRNEQRVTVSDAMKEIR